MDIITSSAVSDSAVIIVSDSAVSVDTLGEIQTTNYLLTAILFCMVFFWIEKKMKNITKKFTRTESGVK